MNAIKERRFKILRIDSRLLVEIFNWWIDPPHWLSLPITDQLPADCQVVSINSNWPRHCIEAIIASDQFEPCPDGDMPPEVPDMLTEFRYVEFRREGEENSNAVH